MGDLIDRNAWHPGFVAAAGLELRDEKGLTFHPEYNLSKEPLRVDLYIHNGDNTPVENEIGRIFRKYNIIEYKSPEDSLNIDDLFKTVGYACIFKGIGETVNKYNENDITVSIFRDTYPRELFSYLESTGRTAEEKFDGIYYITGNFPFPIQIVVTSRLSEKHSGLKILSNNAKEEDIINFIRMVHEFTSPGDKLNASAILQVSSNANKGLYAKVTEDKYMKSVLEELMADVIEAREKKAVEAKAKDSAAELIKMGMDYDKISVVLKYSPEEIRGWFE